MALDTAFPTLLGPPPVAVHDNGNVLGVNDSCLGRLDPSLAEQRQFHE